MATIRLKPNNNIRSLLHNEKKKESSVTIEFYRIDKHVEGLAALRDELSLDCPISSRSLVVMILKIFFFYDI